jgi:hypothetical protein
MTYTPTTRLISAAAMIAALGWPSAAIGQGDGYALLSSCASETFDEASCSSAIANVERQFSGGAAPANLIESLAIAYNNMEYAGSDSSAKTTWENKRRGLFNSASGRAATAEDWYRVSRIAVDVSSREACLRSALAVDAAHLPARQELVGLYIERQDWNQASREWSLLRGSAEFKWEAEWQNGLRLANGIAGAGNRAAGRQIALDAIRGTAEMGSLARCYVFGWLRPDRMNLSARDVSELQDIRRICTDLSHRNNGVAALARGDTAQAIAEFDSQIQENPGYAEPYFLLESTLRASGETDRSLNAVEALFRLQIPMSEKCSGIARVPLNVYRKQDPDFVEQVRRQCALQ